MEEAGHVRRELGYPIIVSPFAQYVMTQAVLNVMGELQGKDRYDTVPDEVRKYVLGYYGEIAGTDRTEPLRQDHARRRTREGASRCPGAACAARDPGRAGTLRQ